MSHGSGRDAAVGKLAMLGSGPRLTGFGCGIAARFGRSLAIRVIAGSHAFREGAPTGTATRSATDVHRGPVPRVSANTGPAVWADTVIGAQAFLIFTVSFSH